MLQIEFTEETEQRLRAAAAEEGKTVEAYVRQSVEERLPRVSRDQHKAAVEGLRTFARRHGSTLGPDLTIRQLRDEGRRY
jgi:predicted DNA-binding protein